MPVIAIIGNKGGIGKTTISINIACGLRSLYSVLLLDADPQQSSSQWREISERNDMIEVADAVESVAESVDRYRQRYECMVIDCPSSVHSEQTKQALTCSDIAVVPVLPSPLDIWATVHVEQELESAQLINAGLKGLLVVNQIEPRTLLSNLIRQSLDEIGLPVARTVIKRRVAYRNAMLQGCSVLDMGASANGADEDIRQLVEEVVSYL